MPSHERFIKKYKAARLAGSITFRMANPPTAAVNTALAEGFVFGGDNSTPPLAKEQKEVQHERGVEKKNRFNRYKPHPRSPRG